MEDFIYKYFLEPVTSHSGYNIVNTLVYALIALLSVYILYKLFEKAKIKIDNEFILGTLSFVLLGSTVRVITDSLDTNTFKSITFIHEIIKNSHFYDYGFLSVSPGIYIVIASIFLLSLFIVTKLQRPKLLKFIGLGLWIPNFLILLPFMSYALYLIPIILLVAIPVALASIYFKDWKYLLVIGSHALDGAATFFMIDVFGNIAGIQYWEQHVFSRIIGDLFGTYFTFYLLKVSLAGLASYFIYKENLKENERNFLLLLIAIIGLAPGIRDVLRMCIGG